ncbi:hypothetical protein I6E29_07795 [Arcanobacterium haemolyticum]|nr:hypothetical protein [Arcanobacterium haemolyticum]
MTSTSIPAILAGDIGGTSCKVVVADLDGEILGYGRAGGGNIRSNDRALDNIDSAIQDAYVAAGSPRIISAHIGIAGAGPARWAEINSAIQARWHHACKLIVTSDIETAFMASSPTENGALLLAGTGAIAAVFQEAQIVARCDGMGWLLGDIGSGVWLGMRVLQAVAADLDSRGAPTALTPALCELAGISSSVLDRRQSLIAWAYALKPTDYGGFARFVFENATDLVGRAIIDEAVTGLVRSLTGAYSNVISDPATSSLVLTGGLLGPGGPLRPYVRQRLDQEYPCLGVVSEEETNSPILGAVRLAARHMDIDIIVDTFQRSLAEKTPF